MAETNAQRKYLTQAEVAEHFCTSESTIKNWRDRGYLPYFQLPDSTRVLYPMDGIEAVERQYTYPAKKGVVRRPNKSEVKRKKPVISATTKKEWRI